MKIKNILFTTLAFAFVGCGTGVGTDPQGAVGNYKTFGNQSLSGVWYVQSSQDYYNIELDEYGNVYTVASNNVDKQKIATYESVSDKELKILIGNNQTVATYIEPDKNNNNCFYVNDQISKQGSIYNGQKVRELWCKQGVALDNNQYAVDARPEILAVDESTVVDLKSFLYPLETLEQGRKVRKEIYNYNQDAQGTIRVEGNKVVKEYTRLKANPITIEETINGYKHKTDEIYASKIFSFTENSYGKYDIEEYPTRVGINSEVVTVGDENIVMTCVVKDIRSGWNLTTLLPNNIKVHLGAGTYDFNYAGKVMHIHCGSTTGITMDSYNAASYGEVLNIITNPDGSGRYEVADRSSIGPVI